MRTWQELNAAIQLRQEDVVEFTKKLLERIADDNAEDIAARNQLLQKTGMALMAWSTCKTLSEREAELLTALKAMMAKADALNVAYNFEDAYKNAADLVTKIERTGAR